MDHHRRRHLERMHEEAEQVDDKAVRHPPKKVKECENGAELEFGIFPDIPLAGIKKEVDSDNENECTSYHFNKEMNEDSIYIKPEPDAKDAATFDDNLNIKSEVNFEASGGENLIDIQPIIKLEVFPDDNHILPKTEFEEEDSNHDQVQLQQQPPEKEIGGPTRQTRAPEKESDPICCPYCRFRGSGKEVMKVHHAKFHPEHFFLQEKAHISGLKLKQFQRIVVDFLFTEFYRKVGVQRSCKLCRTSYKKRLWSGNDISIWKHLIFNHRNELRKRLKSILQEESLEGKLVSCISEGVFCQCGVYLPRWEKMHKREFCNLLVAEDGVRKTLNCSSVEVAREKALDPMECDDKDISGTHSLMDIEEKSGNEMPIPSNDPEVNRNSNPSFMTNFLQSVSKFKVYCKLCTTTIYRKDALVHWNQYCPKELRQPITLKSKQEKAVNHNQSTIRIKLEDWSHRPQPEPEKSTIIRSDSARCPYCRFVCRGGIGPSQRKYEFQLHLALYHPEHFFPEEKKQVAGVKREQFQRILVGFLFPRFAQNNGDFRSCTICGAKYLSRSWYRDFVHHRRHLVVEHKNELKEKLKVILEDDRLEEKLGRDKKSEAWCRCGMYLPRGMETHKRLYCNLGERNDDDDTDDNKGSPRDADGLNPLGASQRTSTPTVTDDQEDSIANCTDCDFRSEEEGNPMEMQMHLIKCHPEHYFTKERDKVSGLGVNVEVFRKLLCFTWQQFIRNVRSHGRRMSFCVLCDKKFVDSHGSNNELRITRHLIFEHLVS